MPPDSRGKGDTLQTSQQQQPLAMTSLRLGLADSGGVAEVGLEGGHLLLDRIAHGMPSMAARDSAVDCVSPSPPCWSGTRDSSEGHDGCAGVGGNNSSLGSSMEGVLQAVAVHSDTSSSVRSSGASLKADNRSRSPPRAAPRPPASPLFVQKPNDLPMQPQSASEPLSSNIAGLGIQHQQQRHSAEQSVSSPSSPGGRDGPHRPPSRNVPKALPHADCDDAILPVSRSWREFMPQPSPPPAVLLPSPSRCTGRPISSTTSAVPDALAEVNSSDTGDQGYLTAKDFQGEPLLPSPGTAVFEIKAKHARVQRRCVHECHLSMDPLCPPPPQGSLLHWQATRVRSKGYGGLMTYLLTQQRRRRMIARPFRR